MRALRQVRRLCALGAGLVLAACAARTSRYQGLLLGTYGLGADELRRQMAADPAIRDTVAASGPPDYVIDLGPDDVELIWVRGSRLVHFHRPEPGAPSETGMLFPLPESLLGLLPQSLHSGTPAPTEPVSLACWKTRVATRWCQTCCKTVAACVTDCRPEKRPETVCRVGTEGAGYETRTPRQNATRSLMLAAAGFGSG